jgi:hypothetical protein
MSPRPSPTKWPGPKSFDSYTMHVRSLMMVFFRHVNFPIGNTVEHEVVAAASCCIEGMRLLVTDVAGETAEAYAMWDGTGSGLSMTTIYAIIGGCAAGVLLIVIIVVAVVCRNKYSSVSQNP